MKHLIRALGLAGICASLLACGEANKPAKDPTTGDTLKTGTGKTINRAAADKFKKAAELLSQHDSANDWTDPVCDSTAKAFEEAGAEMSGSTFEEAEYDAGVAYRRCNDDARAKKIFQDILAKNPKFHRARVQVALYDFRDSGGKDIDKAIGEMQHAVADAEFKNEEALVFLAMFQMLRDNDVKDDDGNNDVERAKGNLQRALAINDGFMPAFNELAIYYLENAKKKAQEAESKVAHMRRRIGVQAASEERKKADTQALELAQLVCSQAIRKNPNYAPVYNTMGLISAELGDLSKAAESFGKARRLEPKFFEAHMNYAAVNLQFRGFEEAAKAYKDAIAIKPNDYEAHLGLALALRGQINDVNFDQMLAASDKELAEAKRIDPDRPETYYNLAILTEEFKTKGMDGEKAVPVFEQAKDLYKQFTDKANGKEEYAAAIKRAEERIKEVDEQIQAAHEIAAANKAAAAAPKPAPPAPAPSAPDAKAPAQGAAPTDKAAAAPPDGGKKPGAPK